MGDAKLKPLGAELLDALSREKSHELPVTIGDSTAPLTPGRFLGLEDIRAMSIDLAASLSRFHADALTGILMLQPVMTDDVGERLSNVAKMKSTACSIRDALAAYESNAVAISAARVVQAAAKVPA